MCTVYADIVQHIIQGRGFNTNDFMAKSNATAPQAQKRGRRVPQLISEFLWTKSILVNSIPSLDCKKCLRHALGDIPAGCKLLRTEANKGNAGDLTLCVFGCYRSMQQFVDVSKQLWHPYDELKNLPDPLVRTLFWYLPQCPFRHHQTKNWLRDQVEKRWGKTEKHGK